MDVPDFSRRISQPERYKVGSAMKTLKGNKIVADFIKMLNNRPDLKIIGTSVSRNVFEMSGRVNCLLYVKAIAKPPHRWGVTANVVNRLEDQSLPWFVILLFDSYENGYLLSSNDVKRYIRNVWPLAADGDYKPSPAGSYLAKNTPFYSLDEFVDRIVVNDTL